MQLFQPLPSSSCCQRTLPNPPLPSLLHALQAALMEPQMDREARPARRRSSGGRSSFSRSAAAGPVRFWTGCVIFCLLPSSAFLAPAAAPDLSQVSPFSLNRRLGKTPLPERGWSHSRLRPEAPYARIGPEPTVHPCFSE